MIRWFAFTLAGVLAGGILATADDDRPAADANFKREGDAKRRARLDPMEWKPAPPIQVERWIQGPATTLEALRGKVVLIDFWGNW